MMLGDKSTIFGITALTTPILNRSLLEPLAFELGIAKIGVVSTNIAHLKQEYCARLAAGYGAGMDYLGRYIEEKFDPERLVPGTRSIIIAAVEYWQDGGATEAKQGAVTRYAWGRDYHKTVKQILERLATTLQQKIGTFSYRVFCDSAPVPEVSLAALAGLGWIGKHGLIINRDRGSWMFLGAIYTSLPSEYDHPTSAHCGRCTQCMDDCPTTAIIAPGVVDARRCISYLTIEHHGSIPEALRPLIGNRIYGCDDCQLVCPWNRFATPTSHTDFAPRHGLDCSDLLALWAWSMEDFERNTRGSAIRRLGYARWQRNIAVALGNMPRSVLVYRALDTQVVESDLVAEHVAWAMGRHG
jgi:epoxyqueuosine reductase